MACLMATTWWWRLITSLCILVLNIHIKISRHLFSIDCWSIWCFHIVNMSFIFKHNMLITYYYTRGKLYFGVLLVPKLNVNYNALIIRWKVNQMNILPVDFMTSIRLYWTSITSKQFRVYPKYIFLLKCMDMTDASPECLE